MLNSPNESDCEKDIAQILEYAELFRLQGTIRGMAFWIS